MLDTLVARFNLSNYNTGLWDFFCTFFAWGTVGDRRRQELTKDRKVCNNITT